VGSRRGNVGAAPALRCSSSDPPSMLLFTIDIAVAADPNMKQEYSIEAFLLVKGAAECPSSGE
jgi:hypothetical protein